MEALTTSSLAELTGGRLISCNFGFQPAIYNIKRNHFPDSIKSHVLNINTYDLFLETDDVSLFVDDQELIPFQGIFAYY